MADDTFVVFYSANATRQTSNDRMFHSSPQLGLAVDALRPLLDTGGPAVDALRPLLDTGGLAVDALRPPDMLCSSHSNVPFQTPCRLSDSYSHRHRIPS